MTPTGIFSTLPHRRRGCCPRRSLLRRADSRWYRCRRSRASYPARTPQHLYRTRRRRLDRARPLPRNVSNIRARPRHPLPRSREAQSNLPSAHRNRPKLIRSRAMRRLLHWWLAQPRPLIRPRRSHRVLQPLPLDLLGRASPRQLARRGLLQAHEAR